MSLSPIDPVRRSAPGAHTARPAEGVELCRGSRPLVPCRWPAALAAALLAGCVPLVPDLDWEVDSPFGPVGMGVDDSAPGVVHSASSHPGDEARGLEGGSGLAGDPDQGRASASEGRTQPVPDRGGDGAPESDANHSGAALVESTESVEDDADESLLIVLVPDPEGAADAGPGRSPEGAAEPAEPDLAGDLALKEDEPIDPEVLAAIQRATADPEPLPAAEAGLVDTAPSEPPALSDVASAVEVFDPAERYAPGVVGRPTEAEAAETTVADATTVEAEAPAAASHEPPAVEEADPTVEAEGGPEPTTDLVSDGAAAAEDAVEAARGGDRDAASAIVAPPSTPADEVAGDLGDPATGTIEEPVDERSASASPDGLALAPALGEPLEPLEVPLGGPTIPPAPPIAETFTDLGYWFHRVVVTKSNERLGFVVDVRINLQRGVAEDLVVFLTSMRGLKGLPLAVNVPVGSIVDGLPVVNVLVLEPPDVSAPVLTTEYDELVSLAFTDATLETVAGEVVAVEQRERQDGFVLTIVKLRDEDNLLHRLDLGEASWFRPEELPVEGDTFEVVGVHSRDERGPLWHVATIVADPPIRLRNARGVWLRMAKPESSTSLPIWSARRILRATVLLAEEDGSSPSEDAVRTEAEQATDSGLAGLLMRRDGAALPYALLRPLVAADESNAYWLVPLGRLRPDPDGPWTLDLNAEQIQAVPRLTEDGLALLDDPERLAEVESFWTALDEEEDEAARQAAAQESAAESSDELEGADREPGAEGADAEAAPGSATDAAPGQDGTPSAGAGRFRR